MRLHRLLLAVFLLSVAVAASAQGNDPPFTAERPGFTNGVATVPPGFFQWEYGYRYSRDGGGSSHQIGDGGQIRAPITDYSEVRFGLPTYVSQRGANGFGDSSISFKYRFRDAEVGHFGFALIGGTTLPTSAKGVGDSFWKPSVALEFEQPLCERLSLQANATYAQEGGRERRFDQSAVALNLGYSVDNRTSLFAETYRYIGGEGIRDATYVDGGVTFMTNRNTQLDVNGGFGVSREVRKDYFLSFGIARRW